MRKSIQRVLRLLSLSLCAALIAALPAGAASGDGGALEVRFRQGAGFQIYYAAAETENGYAAAGQFTQYAVELEGDDAESLRTLSSTLYACVLREQLAPEQEGVTDSSGRLVFDGLAAGLYLLTSPGAASPAVVRVVAGDTVTVNPKEEPDTEDEEISVSVQKVWNDQGHESVRPGSIRAELYQDSVLLDTAVLSAQNGWSHLWQDLPEGHDYFVLEQKVPEGYVVSISQEGNTFLLENTWQDTKTPESPDTPTKTGTGAGTSGRSASTSTPKTGDSSNAELYAALAGVSAAVLLFLIATRKRGRESEDRE